MPNPKRRHSKMRKNKRRAHDHLFAPALAKCPNCHEMKTAAPCVFPLRLLTGGGRFTT